MRSLNNGNKYYHNKHGLLIVSLSLLAAAGTIHQATKKPLLVVPKQESAINVSQNLLLLLSGGNKRLLADLIWVQTLLESDMDQYNSKDLNSWLYLRFNTIHSLDPRFYENYLYGGQFLSIIKDDLEGANDLYAKGVAEYPLDYDLNFQAGFLNYYERRDYKTALTYLTKVAGHPKAPVFLLSIVNKLKYGLSGDLDEVYKLVEQNYLTTKSELLKKRLWDDLYSIRSEIDLNCLNNRRGGCRSVDLEGKPYVSTNGSFRAQKEFLKYEIKFR